MSASRRAKLKRKREESVAARSESRARSSSRTPRDKSGVRDEVVSAIQVYSFSKMLLYCRDLGFYLDSYSCDIHFGKLILGVLYTIYNND